MVAQGITELLAQRSHRSSDRSDLSYKIEQLTFAHSRGHCRRCEVAAATRALLPMILCAGIPIGNWMLWSKARFGDVTGTTMAVACTSKRPSLKRKNRRNEIA